MHAVARKTDRRPSSRATATAWRKIRLPASGGSARLLRVRETLGERRVQAKIEVGPAHDAYERDAERMAEHVMRTPADADREEEDREQERAPEREEEIQRLVTDRQVQREEADAPAEEPTEESGDVDALPDTVVSDQPDTEPVGDEEPEAWPEPEPGELEGLEAVQRKARSADGFVVAAPALAARIAAPPSGRPLGADVRRFVEARTAYDFSGVRVHDRVEDRADASRLDARAFTYGRNIWIGRGESAEDRRLMAHELAHVVQQGGAGRRTARRPSGTVALAPRRVQRGWLDSVVEGVKGALKSVADLGAAAKAKILGTLAGWAKDVPGYPLLTVILGRDPISDRPVPRNAINLIGGLVSLVPGGSALFENLKQSGAVDRAATWFEKQIVTLNLGWSTIKGLFRRAWDALGISDILDPPGAWRKIKAIFLPPLVRLKNFAVATAGKLLEFVFEGAMSLAGPLATQVLGVLRKAGTVLGRIFGDPIGFVKNLVRAVAQGFQQFATNILTHLKKGLLGWLFGALSNAGLTLPEKFDLKGILSIVLQVLGLTYANLRKKLVRVIGEKRVAIIEKSVQFVVLIATQGLAAAWRKLLEYVGSLKDMVIGAIRDWVVTKIVQSAITKLISMFNPAGAIIQAIIAIYNTIMFFVERIKQLIALANSVFDSIGAIALGKLKAAADLVEATMSRTLPVIISFLARLIGLGGISAKIKAIIKKIQAKVDKALTKVINYIVAKAKALFGKIKKGAAAALQWWKKRREVKLGKRMYAIYFEGAAESSRLFISGSPGKGYAAYLGAIDPKTPAQKKAHAEALTLGTSIDKRISRRNLQKTEADQLTTDINRMAGLLSIIVGSANLPPTIVKYGALSAEQGGTEAEARVLSQNSGGSQGSEPADGPPIWTAVKDRRSDGDKRAYVQGHLLNHNVHGPGKRFNMTPITYKANAEHKVGIEKKIKELVLDEAKVVYYRVTAKYDGHPGSPDYLSLKKKPAEQRSIEEKDALAAMEADRKLCTEFQFKAHVLEEENGEYTKAGEAISFDPVKNVIPTKTPSADGSVRATVLERLAINSPGDKPVDAFRSLPEVGDKRARAIESNRGQGYSTWNDLIERNKDEGVTERMVDVWKRRRTDDGKAFVTLSGETIWA
ncbi:MAG: DUF4157 domain-containing protein [Planctomycetes bacterium]|nr:DUF4157 domain-containing protein [Planctomycetota bacterium]